MTRRHKPVHRQRIARAVPTGYLSGSDLLAAVALADACYLDASVPRSAEIEERGKEVIRWLGIEVGPYAWPRRPDAPPLRPNQQFIARLDDGYGTHWALGDTASTAALRAYVHATFGDVVELP